MNNFIQYFKESIEPITEDLRKLGKLKILRDPLRSHKYNMFRGMGRKTLRQVPFSQTGKDRPQTLPTFIRGLDVSSKMVDLAKNANSGVWRVSPQQVTGIATKYKFNLPDETAPIKHLGSTGIQLVMFKPGVFYLYKPHRVHKLRKHRSVKPRKGSLMKGISFK